MNDITCDSHFREQKYGIYKELMSLKQTLGTNVRLT
jgi:hypothetical protein